MPELSYDVTIRFIVQDSVHLSARSHSGWDGGNGAKRMQPLTPLNERSCGSRGRSLREHVHMMSAQGEGSTPKSDTVRKLSKGGCM